MTSQPHNNGNPGIQFYVAMFGQLHRLTHVCDTEAEALAVLRERGDTSSVGSDDAGRFYLAEDRGTSFKMP